MKKIGEVIRDIRESKKISQYAVAYTIGMSQAAYSKIERGETEIKAKHLYLIAGVLGTSVYDLLPASLASSSFDGQDYLLKPVIVKIKSVFFSIIAKKRLSKMDAEESKLENIV